MELLDVVDENNNITGFVEERNIVHNKSLLHRHVICWIMNQNGEVLLQKRSIQNKAKPNLWGKVGGHVQAGEQPEDAIGREIKEEIGIEIDKSKLELIDVSMKKIDNDRFFVYNFLIVINYKIEEFIIEKEEISEVKYFTIEDIEQIIKNKDLNFIFSRWEDEVIKECKILRIKRKKLLKK